MKKSLYLLGFVISVAAGTAEESQKPLKVCTVDWPPFTVMDSKGAGITGIHTEMVQKIFDFMQIKAEITSLPWKRCLSLVETGEYDAVYSASFKDDRAKYMLYPQEALDEVEYVFVTTKDPKTVAWDDKRTFANLPQPLGSPLGFSVTTDLKKEQGLKIDDGAVTDRTNFEKLLAGRVQSIVILRQAYESLKKEFKAEGKVFELQPAYIDKKKYFLTVRKTFDRPGFKATDFAKAVDSVILQMRTTGELKTIAAKYQS